MHASIFVVNNNRRLIAVAGFFLMGKILAGTAVITEFLLITGGADTIPTVAAVIGRSTGVGKSIFFRFFLPYTIHLS